jgi:hypothetical protein
MLAFFKIFICAFVAFGIFPQQELCGSYYYNSDIVCSLQTSANVSFDNFSNTELHKDIIVLEESLDVDDNNTISNNKVSSLKNLNDLPGRKLKEDQSFQFNFSHVTFLEIDLPPPGFFLSK